MQLLRPIWLVQAVLATLVQVGCGGSDDGQPRTVLSYRGSTGDYISQGNSANFTDATSTVITTYDAGYFHTQFMGPSASHFWTLDIASPDGGQLQPGTYVDAWRAGFRDGHNGLDFGGDGRGCNRIFGSFVILEIGFDLTGHLNRFAADFEQRCESLTAPPVRGSVRINSAFGLPY